MFNNHVLWNDSDNQRVAFRYVITPSGVLSKSSSCEINKHNVPNTAC